jgi:site-specific DNA-methyltransferase (cytosine-N4-specific)
VGELAEETSQSGEPLAPEVPPPSLAEGYRTDCGVLYLAHIENLLDCDAGHDLEGNVQLIFTSPPFPLNTKKNYGNRMGDDYLGWLRDLAPRLKKLLTPDGSVVMELGNAWEPGHPTMSTLPLRSLLAFLEAADLKLCQQFVCHNPARLPTPAQWVTVERIRVKDSYTNIWWMSPSEKPKANNRRVLREYSPAMKRLLKSGTYNSGLRPSGHQIGEKSFAKDNGGAIPPNVLQFSNTSSTDPYRQYCRDRKVEPHPAPMQRGVVEFFVAMLTDEDDLVLDPFAGSNMTGAVAEQLGRRWVSTEPQAEFVNGSRGRFPQLRGFTY